MAAFWFGSFLAIHSYRLLVGLGVTTGPIGVVPACLPFLLAFHSLRKSLQTKRRMLSDLENFDITAAFCRKDFDRDFVHGAICQWHRGSRWTRIDVQAQHYMNDIKISSITCATSRSIFLFGWFPFKFTWNWEAEKIFQQLQEQLRYGSLDAFTAYIRGPIRGELLANQARSQLPWPLG